MHSNSYYSKMFLSAALVNWIASLLFIFPYPPVYEFLSLTPLPSEMLFTQQFGVLVFTFGIGYYWASQDPIKNLPIIKLGIIGKLLVYSLMVYLVITGQAGWQFLLLVTVDIIYPMLFLGYVRQQDQDQLQMVR